MSWFKLRVETCVKLLVGLCVLLPYWHLYVYEMEVYSSKHVCCDVGVVGWSDIRTENFHRDKSTKGILRSFLPGDPEW